MDMDGMDMDMDGSNTTMMMMMSVFQTDQATPLYSTAWTPGSTGAYAGTCIFLILLACLFRALLAFKAWQENRWLDAELNRRYVVVQGRPTLGETVSHDSLAKRMTLTENGVEEDVLVLKKKHTHLRPWRLSVDPIRALLDTVIAGVGYLLCVTLRPLPVSFWSYSPERRAISGELQAAS